MNYKPEMSLFSHDLCLLQSKYRDWLSVHNRRAYDTIGYNVRRHNARMLDPSLPPLRQSVDDVYERYEECLKKIMEAQRIEIVALFRRHGRRMNASHMVTITRTGVYGEIYQQKRLRVEPLCNAAPVHFTDDELNFVLDALG